VKGEQRRWRVEGMAALDECGPERRSGMDERGEGPETCGAGGARWRSSSVDRQDAARRGAAAGRWSASL
jgi:hypothetical protein